MIGTNDIPDYIDGLNADEIYEFAEEMADPASQPAGNHASEIDISVFVGLTARIAKRAAEVFLEAMKAGDHVAAFKAYSALRSACGAVHRFSQFVDMLKDLSKIRAYCEESLPTTFYEELHAWEAAVQEAAIKEAAIQDAVIQEATIKDAATEEAVSKRDGDNHSVHTASVSQFGYGALAICTVVIAALSAVVVIRLRSRF